MVLSTSRRFTTELVGQLGCFERVSILSGRAVRQSQAEPTLRGKLRVWFGPPTFAGTGLPDHVPPPVDRRTAVKHDPPLSPALARWLFAQLALTVIGTTAFLFFAERLDLAQRLFAAALLLLGVAASGGLLEKRRWAVPLEVGRWAAVGLVAVLW